MIVMLGAFAMIALGGMGLGNAQQPPPGQQEGQQPPPPRHPGHPLGKILNDKATLGTLSDLTGFPVETIQEEAQDMRMPELLEQYGIDEQTFRDAMDAGFIEQVRQAAACGLITEEEAAEIVDMIQNKPEPEESI